MFASSFIRKVAPLVLSLSDWAVPWTPVLLFLEWCHLVRLILCLFLIFFYITQNHYCNYNPNKTENFMI